jgi:serine protease Do
LKSGDPSGRTVIDRRPASRRGIVPACLATIVLSLAGWRAISSSDVTGAPSLLKVTPATNENLPEAMRKDVPASVADLKSIESRVKEVVGRVSPAVVAVRIDGATGSGVIISADGYVLSAAHVCNEPNHDVRFFFPDGRTARGKTLGTNHDSDAGLMKITDEGPWPHAEVGDLERASPGDWVVAMGHPGGFDRQRSIVARLGRVIRLGSMLQTDCTIISGDSGGPLFDMYGRVIGIHSRISESAAANFHVPIDAYSGAWARLVKGENWGGRRPGSRSFVGARGVDHPEGCRLDRVEEDGPAFKAGLKTGDIVRKVNGDKINDYESFRQSIARSQPGDEIELDVKRDDQQLTVKVTVETRRGRGRGRFGP